MKKITSRKVHRLLSIVIGIQLLLWTVSGLIFSWNPINKVRGEDRVANQPAIDLVGQNLLPLQEVLANRKLVPPSGKVENVVARQLLDSPVYELTIRDSDNTIHVLCNALTGEKLSPISRQLAEKIALKDFNEPAKVTVSTLLTEQPGPHSEYRKKELPAWKIELNHSSGTVIYVSANRGLVVTRRNNRWRMFDFFWMLHTMDYQGRDNFNSWLLRIVSIFGVVSVLSGYWLWWRSRKRKRKPERQKA